jgi:hypothetical protein
VAAIPSEKCAAAKPFYLAAAIALLFVFLFEDG